LEEPASILIQQLELRASHTNRYAKAARQVPQPAGRLGTGHKLSSENCARSMSDLPVAARGFRRAVRDPESGIWANRPKNRG
jgi:hypothetical protein